MFFVAEIDITDKDKFSKNYCNGNELYSKKLKVCFLASEISRDIISNAFRYHAIEIASMTYLYASYAIETIPEESFRFGEWTIVWKEFCLTLKKVDFVDLTENSSQRILVEASREKSSDDTELIMQMMDLSTRLIDKGYKLASFWM